MFIREKKKSKKGVKYAQYQLIKSVRTPAGPRQEIVLNMGQELDVPKEQWKNLANAIEEKLLKTNALFSYDTNIDQLATHYAQLIEKNNLNQKAPEKNNESPVTIPSKVTPPDYISVNIDSIEHADSRSYGGEYLVDSIMNTYEFDTLLKELNFTESQIHYSKMLIGARMLHPSSEREAARWLNTNSTLPEFVGKTGTISDNGLHRAATLLWKNHEVIERKLADTSKNLFSLGEKVILYDLTNTYFESTKPQSSLAEYGRSKEKRYDCPLITLALTVDEEGFPKQSKIYKGAIGEASTLEDILKEMLDVSPGVKQTIVFDAGIATEENISLITNSPYNYSYIAVSRKQSYPDDYWKDCTPEEIILSDKKSTLTLMAERTKHEVFLLCKSDGKKEKENAIYERRMRKFEEGLTYLHEGLVKKRRTKRYDLILEKIGRLKQLYNVGKFYTIDIERNGDTVIKIDFTRNNVSYEHERSRGSYVLRTNRTDLDNSEISQIHRSLTTIEDSFKSMKSHLGLRPIFHQTDINSEAHIHITVLSYHFVIAILKQLRRENIFYNWNSIRELLQSHQRISTTMAAEDGSVIRLRQNTFPNEDQKTIFHAMGTMLKKGLKRAKNIFNQKM
ncbi:MAG: IS1634 family transposase [Candidatus Brocadiaceae bacterium]|nr:IS1634 family transposase [Candidatus Brocadiaceae bacterium]